MKNFIFVLAILFGLTFAAPLVDNSSIFAQEAPAPENPDEKEGRDADYSRVYPQDEQPAPETPDADGSESEGSSE